MTQDNPPGNPSDDPSAPDRMPGKKPAPPPIKPKRGWLGRIVKTFLVLIVLLLVLIGLLPTILSTGAARNFVLGKINDNINGRVAIGDWSLGWMGGIHVNDVKVFDASGRQILQLPRFSTDLKLTDALRGNIHLGNTVIEGLDFLAERDAAGVLNFDKLAKASPKEAEQPKKSDQQAAPSKLPSIDGELHLVNCRGTFYDEQKGSTVTLSTISGDIKIPSINDTIEYSLKIVAKVAGGDELASFSLDGKLLIAKDNLLLPVGQMNIDQTLVLSVNPKAAQQGFASPAPVDSDRPTFQRGKVNMSVKLTSDGKNSGIVVAFDANNVGLSKGAGPTARKVLDNYSMKLALAAKCNSDGGKTHITIDQFDVGDGESAAKLVDIKKSGDKPIEITLAADGKVEGGGLLDVFFDMGRANEIAQAFGSPPVHGSPATAPAVAEGQTKLKTGILKGTVGLGSEHQQLTLGLNFTWAGLTLITATGAEDPIGDGTIEGQVSVAMAAVAPGAAPLSGIDQIAAVHLNNFGFSGLGSRVKINGSIEDPGHARNFKNFTAELTYNAAMLWNAILPTLSKDSQDSLKDTKVQGTHTKTFTFAGSYPADKEFNQAIAALSVSGDLELDRLESKGAVLENFTLPLTLAGGKLSIAYPQGAAKTFAEPASLNGGHMSLAGITVDLSDPHQTLSIPDGTKLLDGVSINSVFASNWLGDSLNSPFFSGTSHATGQISIEVVTCAQLPTDETVNLDVPSNKGVLKLNLKIAKLEIGNALLAKLSSSLGPLKPLLKLKGGKLNLDKVEGDVNDFHVSVHNGITEQDLTVLYGGRDPILKLSGSVVMKTRLMDMVLAIPINVKAVKDIQIPLSGPVNNPTFNVQNALKNLAGIGGISDIGGLLHKPDKSTQPAGQSKDDPLNGIGNLFKKKDKKKDKPTTQPQ